MSVGYGDVYGVVYKDDMFMDKPEPCVARIAVHVHGDMVPVRISNPSDKDITVYRDTHVGDFEQVPESAFLIDLECDTSCCAVMFSRTPMEMSGGVHPNADARVMFMTHRQSNTEDKGVARLCFNSEL